MQMPVSAAPVQQSFAFETGAQYDSNPEMVSDEENPDSVYRGLFIPEYMVQWRRGPMDIRADAVLRVERSSDTEISDNRADPTLSVLLRRAYARGTMSAEARYQEESTRITELQDTGRVFSDSTRTESMFNLGLDHALTQRTRLELEGQYRDVSYDDEGFVDFDLAAVGSTLSFAVSERWDTYVLAQLSHYEPAGETQETSDAVTLIAGVSYQASENLELELSWGASAVSTDESEDEDDWNGGARVSYRGQLLSGEVEYLRTTTASGAGGFESADQVAADLSFRFSELTTFGLRGLWRKNLDESVTDILNESLRIELRSETRLSEFWTLGLALAYRELKDVDESSGEEITLSLRYRLPERF